MGADLRAGNPNADLSDSNRPTKIAEAFSELYDNSWTNAFEELNKRKKVPEIDTIENLLDILKVIKCILSIKIHRLLNKHRQKW